MKLVCKFGYVLLLTSGICVGQTSNTPGLVLPADMLMDVSVKGTKAEYVACRNAVMRSCFAPSKCEAYMKAPCVKVVCAPVPVGKDKDGEPISAMIGGYDGGSPASWEVGTILSADDFGNFRSETWEGAKSNPERVNFCSLRFEALGFIWQYGTTADKVLLKNFKTTATAPTGASQSAATARSSAAASLQSSVASCTDEIRRTQLESQGWSGNVDDVAARLGRFQKDLFEGRCSGHPQAQTYITGANKMLAYGGNPAGSSGGTPSTGAGQDQTAVQRSALDRVQERQAKVDQARLATPGLPKLHESGNEASGCLRPQATGGVVNNCPYAVEYHYCVLRPKKGSWSEAFDCEKSKGGSWQVGPNGRSIMHTDGETTYFFGCKYGETLSKPDGFSPADIEYQRGRGLLGRCAKWGSISSASASRREDASTTPLARPPANSGAATLQQAINQADHEERARQRLITEARERARLAAIAAEQTRVQREQEKVLAQARVTQPAPQPGPGAKPLSGTTSVCVEEIRQFFDAYVRQDQHFEPPQNQNHSYISPWIEGRTNDILTYPCEAALSNWAANEKYSAQQTDKATQTINQGGADNRVKGQALLAKTKSDLCLARARMTQCKASAGGQRSK